MTNQRTVRRLPSIDWIAIAVLMTAIALEPWWPRLQGMAMAAIFLPSVLREIGVLKDADEFTRAVAYRAGFHALAFVTGLFQLTYLLHQIGVADGWLGSAETIKITEGVFLVSYLLQYWGARQGVPRILLGTAAMTVATLPWLLRPEFATLSRLAAMGALVSSAVILVGLAMLVRARPRLGARVLTALMVVVVTTLLVWAARDAQSVWSRISATLQAVLLLGATGWALHRESRSP